MKKGEFTPKRSHTLVFRRIKNLLMHEEDLGSGKTIGDLFGKESQDFLNFHRNLANEG